MATTKVTTTIGINETGKFIGDDEKRIQFTKEQMDALILAQAHAQTLADAFTNYCKMTFASGHIPFCFREDLSKEEVRQILQILPSFQANFAESLFNLMLIFDF